MLSQPYIEDIEDIEDILAQDALAVQAVGQRLAGGTATSRRAGARGYAVIDAGGWSGLAGLARLLGEVPAVEYDAGYGPAGMADWYVPSRNSYSCGEPPSSGELLVRFGTQ